MDDEKAFMELVKANNQGELSDLEIGIHALKAVPLSEGGRGKSGGVREYARAIGRNKTCIFEFRSAAQVYQKLSAFADSLRLFQAYEKSSPKARASDKTRHFSVIYKADEQHWEQLGKLLFEKNWTIAQTELAVSIIKSSDIPEVFQQWLEPEKWTKDAIASSLETEGYKPLYAIHVRPYQDGYQVVSGHHRRLAAIQAGFDQIPAWSEEMDDEKAFMELVLANRHGELHKLEIGHHALKAVPLGEKGRGKIGGLRQYADALGFGEKTIRGYRDAAFVDTSVKCVTGHAFLDKTTHLEIIGRVPEQHWHQLVKLLMEKEWTKRQTELAVSIIKSSDIPEVFQQWLEPEKWTKDAIASSLEEEGYKPLYAIHVRPYQDGYQVVSGHHRRLAAIQAGFDQIPAWSEEMDDEKAFMELVLANRHGELHKLEIGHHALKAVPLCEKGRGKIGGLRQYADALGFGEKTVRGYRDAAFVDTSVKCVIDHAFLDKTTHLEFISRSPEQHWHQLVKLLMEKDWTVKQTECAVSIVKSSDIPEVFQQWLEPEKWTKDAIDSCSRQVAISPSGC